MPAPRHPTRIGRYETTSVAGEKVRAFIPPPLPPVPPIAVAGLQAALERAQMALGRLDGMASILPDTGLFLYMYVRKEALLSSQIEGTQSSLSDLLLFESEEAPGVPIDDVAEVSCYVAALNRGMELLRGGLPLSLRLIREIHAVLLSSGRGAGKQPGEFRSSQNWIGGPRPGLAAFIPPPPQHVLDCLSDVAQVYGPDCELVLAKEITKAFEGFIHGTPSSITTWLQMEANRVKGEFVIIIPPKPLQVDDALDMEGMRVLGILCAQLPLKQAVKSAAEITGINRNKLYALALRMQKHD